MKIVIDTNIWISYLIGSLLQNIDKKILLKEIKLVVSDEMLKELSEVSNRPKFKNIFTAKRIKELFSLLDSYAIVVSPSRKVNVCRDGKADYLVTGDDDLLVLNPFHHTEIVTPKDFEDILSEKE